jgi:hypothetical protein
VRGQAAQAARGKYPPEIRACLERQFPHGITQSGLISGRERAINLRLLHRT